MVERKGQIIVGVLGQWAAFTLVILLLVACTPAPILPVADQSSRDWPIASPQEAGIDPRPLDQVFQRIEAGDYQNIHSILIVKDGALVFEEYFPGHKWDYNGEGFRGEATDFDSETPHNLASVTKSFTSVLVGIAIERGFIGGVDEKIFDFFPEYAQHADDVKATITIEDLLTMTSGLEWNGMQVHVSTRDPNNDLIQLFMAPDPVDYILAKPLVSQPGDEWYYNGGGTNLLGEIIHRATGKRMDHFASEYLFTPLNIQDYEWDFINPELVHASGNLALRPRDMAKLGYLFLSGGKWRGEQIISEDWVRRSTKHQATTTWGEGYGYQWWLRKYHCEGREYDSYYAAGWGGQRITVFPSLNTVLVFTGGNYLSDEPVDEIIESFILPALDGG